MNENKFNDWHPIPDTGEETVEKALIRQIAAMAALGTNITEISRHLKLTRSKAVRLLNSEECKVIVRKIGENALNTSLSAIRSKMYELTKKAMQVLEKHLDDGNLNAVTLVLRTVDKESKLPEQVSDTNITIVMPTSKPSPVTINASSEEVPGEV